MKLIIAGSRHFDNYKVVEMHANELLSGLKEPVLIITGGARGADALGALYARLHGLEQKVFMADWYTHGRAAGPIRNEEMAKEGDHLLLFWDMKSRGSASMKAIADRMGLGVTIIPH